MLGQKLLPQDLQSPGVALSTFILLLREGQRPRPLGQGLHGGKGSTLEPSSRRGS